MIAEKNLTGLLLHFLLLLLLFFLFFLPLLLLLFHCFASSSQICPWKTECFSNCEETPSLDNASTEYNATHPALTTKSFCGLYFHHAATYTIFRRMLLFLSVCFVIAFFSESLECSSLDEPGWICFVLRVRLQCQFLGGGYTFFFSSKVTTQFLSWPSIFSIMLIIFSLFAYFLIDFISLYIKKTPKL